MLYACIPSIKDKLYHAKTHIWASNGARTHVDSTYMNVRPPPLGTHIDLHSAESCRHSAKFGVVG